MGYEKEEEEEEDEGKHCVSMEEGEEEDSVHWNEWTVNSIQFKLPKYLGVDPTKLSLVLNDLGAID